MQLGFLTHFTEDEIALASQIGFTSLEVHVSSWPANVFISQANMRRAAREAEELLGKYDVQLSAIARYSPNPLMEPVKETQKQYDRYLAFAAMLGVPVLTSMAGRIPSESVDATMVRFKKLFTVVARMAEDHGVKIGFENWPGMGGYPMQGVNIAYMPQHWDRMFDAVPSPALGLEFDPSHLYWQGIDYLWAVRQYADRIYHIHAKDTEILVERRNQCGNLAPGGWWRYRIPGWGEIDWTKFISALCEIGYAGGIAIEHEDPIFIGERRVEGLILGYKHLSERLALRVPS